MGAAFFPILGLMLSAYLTLVGVIFLGIGLLKKIKNLWFFSNKKIAAINGAPEGRDALGIDGERCV